MFSGSWSPTSDFEDVEVLWPEPKRCAVCLYLFYRGVKLIMKFEKMDNIKNTQGDKNEHEEGLNSRREVVEHFESSRLNNMPAAYKQSAEYM